MTSVNARGTSPWDFGHPLLKCTYPLHLLLRKNNVIYIEAIICKQYDH
jgi:hypothetical protein